MGRIGRVQDLHVYSVAHRGAMDFYRRSRSWPHEERYALTNQILRSSRSVCANLAEAWAKRRYPAHFVSKLSDAHAEALETLVWLEFASDCGYLDANHALELSADFDLVVAGYSG